MRPGAAPGVCVYSSAYEGGSGWFVFALAESIARAGSTVWLVAPMAVPIERDPVHPNIRRIRLLRGAAGKGHAAFRALRSLRRVAATFPMLLRARLGGAREFVLTHYDWLAIWVLQFLWIKLIGGRLTFVVHDATPHASAFPPSLRGFERWLLRLSYRLPDRVVTLTRAARDEVMRDYGRRDRISVIPHGAFMPETPPAPMPGNSVLLVFGMLRRNKRILETIEGFRLALADHPELRLVIAGAPHAEDRTYWQQCEAAMAGLGDAIHAEIGFVEEARVAELVAESDALLLPYEDFNSQSGVAILACFAERLMVATDVGGLGELTAEGLETVPVSRPVSAHSIAQGIGRFAALPLAERRAMASRSFEALRHYLSWDEIGRRYVELFR